MSLYNVLFGQNDHADAILRMLGLTKEDCGRFRNCGVADGEIYVYTRNGGGNRDCWCEGDPKYGNPSCKHHMSQEEVDEYVLENYSYKPTGRRVVETRYHCEEPNSAACGCPGCIVNHRLPSHPLYLRDQDDDFDCTYATIYFRFPEEFAEGLRALDSGLPWNPDARWREMLAALTKAQGKGETP